MPANKSLMNRLMRGQRVFFFFNNLLLLQMRTMLPLDYVQYIQLLAERCWPTHYPFAFYIREDSEILRFKHFKYNVRS